MKLNTNTVKQAKKQEQGTHKPKQSTHKYAHKQTQNVTYILIHLKIQTGTKIYSHMYISTKSHSDIIIHKHKNTRTYMYIYTQSQTKIQVLT